MKKILHLICIGILLLGNTLFCSPETAPMVHHGKVTHQEESNMDCCPTQHPVPKNQLIQSILQKEVTKKKSIANSVCFFGRVSIIEYLIPGKKVYIVKHLDKQHYFFSDTIRLII